MKKYEVQNTPIIEKNFVLLAKASDMAKCLDLEICGYAKLLRLIYLCEVACLLSTYIENIEIHSAKVLPERDSESHCKNK